MRSAQRLAQTRAVLTRNPLPDGSGHSSGSVALWSGARGIHRQHSPDRTHSQQVQDRQNAFRWSAHHVFRPHQHFTYDPTSWSRTLAEKAKGARPLSLVERVRLAAEHDAERRGNLAAVAQSSATPSAAEAGDEPDYFFNAGDTQAEAMRSPAAAAEGTAGASTAAVEPDAWAAVRLQELVDEVQRLGRLLGSPRHAGHASLQRRARRQQELATTLLQLYQRLSTAQLGETVTLDAAAFGWFLVRRHLEPLAQALAAASTAAPGHAPAEEGDDGPDVAVMRRIFAALETALLRAMDEGGPVFEAATAGRLSLEALIELLDIATAPFVRHCAGRFEAAAVADDTVLVYADAVAAAARERACGGGGDAAEEESAGAAAAVREWLDPPHLAAWAASLSRLLRRGGSSTSALAAAPALAVQVEHAAAYVACLLEAVTATTPTGHMAASLARPTGASAYATDEEGGERPDGAAPKPVHLNATSAPRGVQQPPTECGDVNDILAAATAVVQLAEDVDAGDRADLANAARRVVRACLRMTTHTPNFDLAADTVVAWACAVLDGGHLVEVEAAAVGRLGAGQDGGGHASLRFVLLLSRLSYGAVGDRAELGRLVVALCSWPEPGYTTARERAEWRRLRGVAVSGAFGVLTAADLERGAARHGGSGGGGNLTWLEAVARGEYGGAVPVALWRDAALAAFPHLRGAGADAHGGASSSLSRTAARCRPEEAEALCVLCARLLARAEAGAPAPTNLRSVVTAQCMAECLGVLRGDSSLAAALMRTPELWSGVAAASLPPSLHALAAAMEAVVRGATASAKVMTF